MRVSRKMGMWILRIVVYSALIYGGVRYFEWKNIYYPTKEIKSNPGDYGLGYEDVVLVTEDDARLHGWWIPHSDARGSIIMFHGNAGNIGGRAWLAPDLHNLGLNVLMFDYRGYGRSEGLPSERGTYRDARAAYEYVRVKHGNAEDPPIVLYGRSLGGAIATQCAVDKPVRGLILESTFASVPAMAREMYPGLPLHKICGFKYDTLEKIGRIDAPLLISASENDTLVPSAQGREIFEAAEDPKIWCYLTGEHNESGWQNNAEYWRVFRTFIDENL